MKNQRIIHKTIRITSETNDFINSYYGTTYNDKINNLLEYYIDTDTEYKKYLTELENQIEEKKQLLKDFQDKISKFQDLLK